METMLQCKQSMSACASIQQQLVTHDALIKDMSAHLHTLVMKSEMRVYTDMLGKDYGLKLELFKNQLL